MSTPRTDTHTPRWQSAIRNPQSAILFVFALMLAASWQRWSSIIADSGREMDLPLRLLRGELLYRDVYYLYPPLSPYLNAFFYKVFGAHLTTLYLCGIAGALGALLLSYQIARRLLPSNLAALASFSILVLCIFKPAGSLIAPYSFAALYGLLFVLGALLCALRFAPQPSHRQLILCGVLCGLAAITKQEFALAACVAVACALWIKHNGRWLRLTRDAALVATTVLFIAVPTYAYFFAHVGWATLVEDCHLFFTHLPPSLVFYNARRLGLDHPWTSLAQMLGGAGVAVLCLCGLLWLSLWRTHTKAGALLRQRMIWTAGLSLLAISLAYLTANGRWDGSPLRALPILLAGLLIAHWRKPKDAALVILCATSLALLARVALRVPSGGAFGSFFLPTSLIMICYGLCVIWPRAIERWTNNSATAKYAQRASIALMCVALLVSASVFAIRFRRNFSFPVVSPHGRLYTTRANGQVYQETLNYLAQHTQSGEAIAVLPEGSDLAFLSGHPMALRLQIAHPGFLDAAGEQAEIARLVARRVRFVLIVNRPMTEFGATAFGRDYFPLLGQWLATNYRVTRVCGAPNEPNIEIGDPRFFIKILERRTDVRKSPEHPL